jgi:hypothetical protein
MLSDEALLLHGHSFASLRLVSRFCHASGYYDLGFCERRHRFFLPLASAIDFIATLPLLDRVAVAENALRGAHRLAPLQLNSNTTACEPCSRRLSMQCKRQALELAFSIVLHRHSLPLRPGRCASRSHSTIPLQTRNRYCCCIAETLSTRWSFFFTLNFKVARFVFRIQASNLPLR